MLTSEKNGNLESDCPAEFKKPPEFRVVEKRINQQIRNRIVNKKNKFDKQVSSKRWRRRFQ